MYRASELFVLWIDNGLGKELESLVFESFEDAKKYGDILVVTITPDQHVNKGPNRPVFNINQRISFLETLNL